MSKFGWIRLFFFGLFFVLGVASSALAQNVVSTGAISGQVTDPTGAVVPGVAVKLTNVSTGVERVATTNSAGLYRFPVLEVGTYTIEFSKAGFQTVKIENAVVQVGQATAGNAQLAVGSITQTVTVTAVGLVLRPTDASVSTVVNQTLIQDLPLSGRRYTDFVLLTPNVNPDGDFGLVSFGGQQGAADSGYANGNGADSFTVDGASASSNYFGEARGRTRVPYIFGEQSIQEFQVADNPYNAAYGGGGSGFVNTVTKSGTDAWHGDAFYYNRNSGVGNANDAIDKANGVPRPLDVLQQFGADLGGPIAKHKAWLYFDYEQQRRKEPISVINPGYASLDETSFGVPAGTPLPAPNGPFPVPAGFSSPPPPSDKANFPIYLQQVSNALNAFQSNLGLRKRRSDDLSFFPKLDWQPTAADRLTLVYNYNKFDSPGGTFTFNPVPSFGDEALPNNFVRDHHASAHWTHTFGATLLNDLHLSFLRDEQISTPSGLIPPNLPTVYNFSRGFFALGNPTFAVGDTKEFQWQVNDRISYYVGRHTLDFGFDFDRTHISDFFPGNFQGTYLFFGDPSNFALGNYQIFQQAAGNPVFPFTYPYYGFYAQDKFQATKRLTLDFGLREDFQLYPQPQANNTTGFPLIARLTGQFPNQVQRLAPRFGFAYQPFPKTVVRGGFGVFREIFDGLNYENSVVSNGVASRQSTTSVFCFHGCPAPNQRTPSFPNPLPGNAPGFGASSNISIVDPGFQTPYILESSLEIQQEVLPNTTVAVGTMWTHGVHLISSTAYDLNLCPPQGIAGSSACLPLGTTTFTVCPGGFNAGPPEGCAGAAGPKVVLPNLDSGLLGEGALIPAYTGQINALITPGVNNYNSFYVQIQRRATQGLALLTSYTFSKGLQSNGVDFNNQFDFSNTRGPTLLDQRHRLSIAAVYSPATPAFANDFARALASHWTISTVMAFNAGRPYTALLLPSADTVNDSAANESTGNTATGIAGAAPSPFVGYNSFYGPWINEIDLGISRGFHLTERQTITLTAQVFNLFNHANFFVQNGGGIFASQFDTNGATCGDGGTTTGQACFLTPDPAFKTLQSINQLNGPRTFQFAFRYQF
ncbi:MAG TPA: TonB-dependent receptor [Candidatus Acidoferrales bacterium]|nr:TonB-dependent receptor [Candidatus Acidoferrales bacterium]